MSSPSPSSIERQYTPVEIASIMKVGEKTVRGWLRDKSHPLTGTKIGTMWRVPESKLKEFLKGNDSD
jgi:excisionase family DNA binding protein